MQDAIPAATVVIFRESASGPPELLMVERAKAMAFAGGALVFPGGRIDPGDHALAATLPDALKDAAARIAAIRETIEETGLAIGLDPVPDSVCLTSLRDALAGGALFGELIEAAGLKLDLAVLTPFARWRPAHEHARIFDTLFYIARARDKAPAASVDATENVRLFWSTAQGVLDDADAGRARIIFPTRRNLERLARFAGHADAVADAAQYPTRTITPWIEQRDDGHYICIDADLGYPVTAERASTASRA